MRLWSLCRQTARILSHGQLQHSHPVRCKAGLQTQAAAFAAEVFHMPTDTSSATAALHHGGLDNVIRRLTACNSTQHVPVSNRHAAVLVPLFEDDDGVLRVWLTQRSSSAVSTHQGEVCLPGGKRDERDADDIDTALREAHEEMGLPRDVVRVHAKLPPFLSKHHLSVTPVLATVPCDFVPQPNEEVAAVFSMPLSSFLATRGYSFKDMSWGDVTYRVHYFNWEHFVVWGLTAVMLIEVAQRVFDCVPGFHVTGPNGIQYNSVYWDGQKLCVRETVVPDSATSAVSQT